MPRGIVPNLPGFGLNLPSQPSPAGPPSIFVDPYRNAISCSDLVVNGFAAGVNINLKGPSGLVMLGLPDPAPRYTLAELPPSPFESGIWEISGTETDRFNFFQWHLPVYPMRGQNIQMISTISKELGVKLRWDPNGYKLGDMTLATLVPPYVENVAKGIICNVSATDGQVFIPPTLLKELIGADSQLDASLGLQIVPTYEIRRSETKSGQTFPTFIESFYADFRPVTIQ